MLKKIEPIKDLEFFDNVSLDGERCDVLTDNGAMTLKDKINEIISYLNKQNEK